MAPSWQPSNFRSNQSARLFTPFKSPSRNPVAAWASNGGLLFPSPRMGGNALFVDVENGADTNAGNPGAPFASIEAALDAASVGDSILVMPGTYEENLVVSKDFISLIGVYSGYGKPDIAPAAGVVLTVTGQGFEARSVRFAGSDSDTVIQNGNGFMYDNCVFDGAAGQAATEACLRLVGLAADDSFSASEGVVQNSLVRGSTSGIGIAFQHAANPSGVGVSDVQILNNRFYGNAVDLKTLTNASGGGAGILLTSLIAGNSFMTTGAAYVYGDMDQGAAGDLAANSFEAFGNSFADDALIAAQFAMGGQPKCFFVGNYDAAGLVDGSTFNN